MILQQEFRIHKTKKNTDTIAVIKSKGLKGEYKMISNNSIQCSVNNCKHHAQDVNYCTLEKIKVGTHEKNPTQIECTDCESFDLK